MATIRSFEAWPFYHCPLSVDDAEEVCGWAGDERVTKYVSYSTHADIASVRRWLEGLETDGETYTFGFMLKTTHMLIGCGDIGYSAKEEAWDFGYNFRADCWGKGYVTEAARRMIQFAFEKKGARDFIANHAVVFTQVNDGLMRFCIT